MDLAQAIERAERAEAEVKRMREFVRVDTEGLANNLREVMTIASGFDWICEGRGPYRYDDDRYRMEVGNLITRVIKVSSDGLLASGQRYTEAFYPRAKITNEALIEECAKEDAAVCDSPVHTVGHEFRKVLGVAEPCPNCGK